MQRKFKEHLKNRSAQYEDQVRLPHSQLMGILIYSPNSISSQPIGKKESPASHQEEEMELYSKNNIDPKINPQVLL